MTIEQIKQHNQESGRHFFDKDTLQFFRSRIFETVYEGPGGIFFVTSKQFVGSNGVAAPRKLTVRRYNPETGAVETAGGLDNFNQLSQHLAIKAAKAAAGGSHAT